MSPRAPLLLALLLGLLLGVSLSLASRVVAQRTAGSTPAVASTPQAVSDSFDIRRSALTQGVPHFTTIAGARAAVHAVAAMKSGPLEVAPLQSYFRSPF